METQRLSVTRATGDQCFIEVPLESIHLGGLGVKAVSLDSLERLDGLETLWLYRNNLENIDLCPLAAASNLRSFSLGSNHLRTIDLSPLENCHRLTEVDLSSNQIRHVDLDPLGTLDSLESLNLRDNALHKIDLSPLEHCSSLRVLDLSGQTAFREERAGHERAPDSCRSDRLDITPLFLSRSLETVFAPSDTELSADPSLKHVITGRSTKATKVVRSAPEDLGTPRMKWLNPELVRRIVWPQYDVLFSELGSSVVLARLLRILNSTSSLYSFHLQKGMMEGFDMEWLSGVDYNPQEIVAGLSSDEPWSTARNKVMARAFELLRKQVSGKGSTLFVAVEKLVEHNQADLATLIVDRRADEMCDAAVVDHGDYIDVSGLRLTAYGLTMMDALRMDSSVISPHQFRRISQELEEAGFRIRVESVNRARHASRERPRHSKSLLKFVLQDRAFDNMNNRSDR